MEIVKIKTGVSLFAYVYPLIYIGIFFGLYFFLRKKSQKVQFYTLFGILAFNLVLHFAKLLLPQYYEIGFPQVLRKCTFESICAVSTMLFPFIYISKNKAMKDYMFYLGVISGFIGCIVPMPVIGMEFYRLEVMRYYFCHASLWIVPLLMVMLGHHKLDYRRNYKTICIYFCVLGLIMVNELILIRLGWVDKTFSLDDFFSADERDMGYAIGLPEKMQGAAKFVLWLTPKAWKQPHYIPILWELFPVIILGGAYTILACLYWEHAHIKSDCILIKNKTVELYGKLKAKLAARHSSTDETEKTNDDEEEGGDN